MPRVQLALDLGDATTFTHSRSALIMQYFLMGRLPEVTPLPPAASRAAPRSCLRFPAWGNVFGKRRKQAGPGARGSLPPFFPTPVVAPRPPLGPVSIDRHGGVGHLPGEAPLLR